MLTGRRIREARALPDLNRSRFAHLIRTVTTATIIAAQAVDDEPPITTAQADAISRALDKFGIEFGPFRVRLRQDGV